MTDALGNALAKAGQGCSGDIWIALQKLIRCSLETHERRRIDAVRQVSANRADGSLIPDSEAYGMHAVVEIIQIVLMESQRKLAGAAINISHIVKKHTLDVAPDQGESQLDVIEEQGIPAQRETGGLIGLSACDSRCTDIAWACLIVRKRP